MARISSYTLIYIHYFSMKMFHDFPLFCISLLLSFMSQLGKGLIFTDWVTERSKNTRLCFNLKSAVFHRVQEWFSFHIPFFARILIFHFHKWRLKIVQIGMKKRLQTCKVPVGHWHLKLPNVLIQVPPLWHGFCLKHSLISTVQWAPVKPLHWQIGPEKKMESLIIMKEQKMLDLSQFWV